MINTLKKPKPDYRHKINTTYTNPINREVTCDECEAILSYESISDTHVGEFGARYITCPYCDNEIITDEDGINITVDNIKEEYFTDFTNGVDIDFDKVKSWIKHGVKHLDYYEPDAEYYFTSSGNTFVCVFKGDGDECDYYAIWSPYGYKEIELKKN